jgi:hypothetical protein
MLRGTIDGVNTWHNQVTSINIKVNDEDRWYRASQNSFADPNEYLNLMGSELLEFDVLDEVWAKNVRVVRDFEPMEEVDQPPTSSGGLFSGRIISRVKAGVLVQLPNGSGAFIADKDAKQYPFFTRVTFDAADGSGVAVGDPDYFFEQGNHKISACTPVQTGARQSDPLMQTVCNRNNNNTTGSGQAPPGTLVIWHDFAEDKDIGGHFAKAYLATGGELGENVVHIHANVSLAATMEQVTALAGRNIDKVLIMTHGNLGQLWLGATQGNTSKSEDVMGVSQSGKDLVAPEAVGDAFLKALGAGVRYVFGSCHMADEDVGWTVIHRFVQAAQARVVAAAAGMVFLHVDEQNKKHSVIAESGVYAFLPNGEIRKLKGNSLPIYM